MYLDTSVISYLEQDDAPEKMADTRAVWESLKKGDYDISVSQVVLKELNDCKGLRKKELFFKHLHEINFNIVDITEDTITLAEKFIDFGILKQKIWMIANTSQQPFSTIVTLLFRGISSTSSMSRQFAELKSLQQCRVEKTC